MVAGDDAEDDRSPEVHHRAADLGAVLKLPEAELQDAEVARVARLAVGIGGDEGARLPARWAEVIAKEILGDRAKRVAAYSLSGVGR